jgi:hypothetical protein
VEVEAEIGISDSLVAERLALSRSRLEIYLPGRRGGSLAVGPGGGKRWGRSVRGREDRRVGLYCRGDMSDLCLLRGGRECSRVGSLSGSSSSEVAPYAAERRSILLFRSTCYASTNCEFVRVRWIRSRTARLIGSGLGLNSALPIL